MDSSELLAKGLTIKQRTGYNIKRPCMAEGPVNLAVGSWWQPWGQNYQAAGWIQKEKTTGWRPVNSGGLLSSRTERVRTTPGVISGILSQAREGGVRGFDSGGVAATTTTLKGMGIWGPKYKIAGLTAGVIQLWVLQLWALCLPYQ